MIIAKMNADEVYQFTFGETFCNFNYSLTVSKKNEKISLHVIICKLEKNRNDSIYSKLEAELDKTLTSKDWTEFINAMQYADFWGLKALKEETGFDGSSLKVEGIIRNHFDFRIVKANSIQRRFIHNTAIYSAFSLLLKFAAIENECDN